MMLGKYVDLHMHSRCSDDGEFSSEELVRRCRGAGIRVMAVTDHNSTRANAPARRAAEAAGITYIAGIEIDCVFEGRNFHVLGLGIDDASADFARIERNIADQAIEASRRMLQKTQELGFAVTEDALRALPRTSDWEEVWTPEMVAEILLHSPEYAAHPLLAPYRPGGARADNPYVNFYWDYYSQGKPCYVEIVFPPLEQVVDIIHRNGGRAVLAHPGVNLNGFEALFDPVLRAGIDGIEAFSSYHTPEQRAYYAAEAKRRALFVTCGSDYHGKIKPAISLGAHGGGTEEISISLIG